MTLQTYIEAMPKVEMHVHLEGAVRPETLLMLAARNGVKLPAHSVEGLREWYTFTDFWHFVDVYSAVSACMLTAGDIELVAREFLEGQAAQNIRYSEVTYTAFTHYKRKGIPFEDQMAALNRAVRWAEAELGATMRLIIDIPREAPMTPDEHLMIAGWAVSGMKSGVVALGLGGMEVGYPPEMFREAFDLARSAGLASVPHAGETGGPESIWGALRDLHAQRIGHGVRCLDDPALVAELRERQVPLEVCPTSNVCLGVAPSMAEHPLPRLLDEGLYVTLNSDDPPMFNTSLTGEYLAVAEAYNMGPDQLEALALNGVRAALLPEGDKAAMQQAFGAEFARLRAEHL